MWDVYENSQYGDLSESNTVSSRVRSACLLEFLQKKCKTAEEFNRLVGPYLNNRAACGTHMPESPRTASA